LLAAVGGKHLEIARLLLDHGANPNQAGESSGNCVSMAKFVGASREMQELLASYGGVIGADMADVETLAAMLHANPKLPVSERLDNPDIMRLILRYQPDLVDAPAGSDSVVEPCNAKNPGIRAAG
jgi:ankyrin repeat protein